MKRKIFIIGLPRTGTTSVCVKMLDLGFTVAHTAYVNSAFDDAQVLADTPIFGDYQRLDKQYPNSLFIFLTRDRTLWLPSIQQLLTRMLKNLLSQQGGFNPIIKRCYLQVFPELSADKLLDEHYLLTCYNNHEQQVKTYFKERTHDLLILDVSQASSAKQLREFLTIEDEVAKFEVCNAGGKVTAWNDIKHPNKIASTRKGRAEKLFYLKDNS